MSEKSSIIARLEQEIVILKKREEEIKTFDEDSYDTALSYVQGEISAYQDCLSIVKGLSKN